MKTNLWWLKADQRFQVGRQGETRGRVTKTQEETFAGDGYVHYLDCGDGVTGVYLRENSSMIAHFQLLNVS